MKKELQRFKVGDSVEWQSQSQGDWLKKVGLVAEVVEAHRRPTASQWPQLWKGAGPGFSRDHESYIVLVGKKVYWPRVSKLTLLQAGKTV